MLAPVAVGFGLLVATPAVAPAATLPFTDPNTTGYIGFCDRAGQQVMSGNLTDEPFAWTAVSSAPAPHGYEQGKATLAAFQPRPQVPPGEWSGQQLTGSSTFSDPAHPLVQATPSDSPLLDFVQAYPPKVDGLVELRIYFSGINLPVQTRTYPATVVQVSGNTWTEVSGGAVNCSAAGHGTSDESIQLPASEVNSPQPINTAGLPPGAYTPPTTTGSATGSTPPSTSASTSPPTSTATPAGGGTSPAAGTRTASAAPVRHGGSGLGAGAIAGIAIGAAAAVGLVAMMLRWRSRQL